jgi:uncharacterized Zn-binding protein involved in type VI secretion
VVSFWQTVLDQVMCRASSSSARSSPIALGSHRFRQQGSSAAIRGGRWFASGGRRHTSGTLAAHRPAAPEERFAIADMGQKTC